MNELQAVITRALAGTDEFLSQVEVREALDATRAGDERAFATLVEAFGPLLGKLVRRFSAVLTDDEATSAAVIGFYRAAMECDGQLSGTGQSFTALVEPVAAVALKEAAQESSAVSVPKRTLERFFGILRRAGGNVAEAALIAPEYQMSREAFYAVAEAIRCGSLDVEATAAAAEALAAPEAELSALETRELVCAAFAVVDEGESVVLRSAYGFSDYRAKSDAEVSAEVGKSRAAVQRVRVRGLGKMREALAVDVVEG